MLINWLIGKSENKERSGVVWNAIGGMFNAGQAAIILVFVSYKLGLIVAGMVTISYAVATLFLSLGRYGIRNYQVTDVKKRFTFGDYFYGRCVTVLSTFILSIAYLLYCLWFSGYSLGKGLLLLEITVLKLVDAFEDVYVGRYQQIGRLDIGAKIMGIRLIISTVFICILILLGANIYIAFLGGIAISVILDIYFLKSTFKVTGEESLQLQTRQVKELLKICLPLCIGTTLSIYIGNVPKYMIDAYMGEEVQAVFGYIMMPVFVITLLNQFIYQPMVKKLGDLWAERDYKGFKKGVLKQCLVVGGLSVIVMIAGMLFGLPVLSLFYNTELSIYRMEFAVLLLGGGAYALAYYLNVPITTIRKQNYIAYGYIIAAVLSLFFGRYFVLEWGMMGAAVLYLCINMLLAIVYSIVLIVGYRQEFALFSNL